MYSVKINSHLNIPFYFDIPYSVLSIQYSLDVKPE